jgi:hypothetical protein
VEIEGPSIFSDGCPVCLGNCCCSSKTKSCSRSLHCYRKCPASKQEFYKKEVKVEPLDLEAVFLASVEKKRKLPSDGDCPKPILESDTSSLCSDDLRNIDAGSLLTSMKYVATSSDVDDHSYDVSFSAPSVHESSYGTATSAHCSHFTSLLQPDKEEAWNTRI